MPEREGHQGIGRAELHDRAPGGTRTEERAVSPMVSEEIKRFLDFVDESRKEYSSAMDKMHLEEKPLQDFLHAIEFEPTAKERSKITTKLHKSRQERRRQKDTVEELEELVRFFQEPQHKKTLDQMTQLLGRIRKVEKYHAERQYKPRVPEGK